MAPTSGLDRLPNELIIQIYKYLRYEDAVALRHTCRYFFEAIDPGFRPRAPQTLQAWGPKPVYCKILLLSEKPNNVLHSLLSGTDMLGLYMATSHDRDSLTLRVDGQDITLGLYTPANGLGRTAGTDRPDIVDADGVIMVYDLLSRDDFEFAFAYCSDLQWDIRLEGPGLEIPIFLLGVNISDQKRSDSAMSEQEISEKARQLRAGHFKVNFGHPDQDAKALLPILEPFIGIAQGIRQAVKDYVEMRSHKYFMETHPFSLPTTADPNTVTGWSNFN